MSNYNASALCRKALEMRAYSYVPYSHFHVGAALLCEDGTVYGGCNIENAAYTPTNCAERTAFFKAVSEGERDFEAIAIVGGFEDSDKLGLCAPCGVCRQVMMEFCNPKTFEIILMDENQKLHTYTLEEILPLGFGPVNMGI